MIRDIADLAENRSHLAGHPEALSDECGRLAAEVLRLAREVYEFDGKIAQLRQSFDREVIARKTTESMLLAKLDIHVEALTQKDARIERLNEQVAIAKCIHESLMADVKNLRIELDRLNRKIAHGCTDAECAECDETRTIIEE